MRRSFGSGNNKMGGGGGNNGGGMLKSLSRAIARSNPNLSSTTSAVNSSTKKKRNHAQKKPNSTNLLSLSNSSSNLSTNRGFVDSSSLMLPNWSYCEEFDWICVDGDDDQNGGIDDDDEFVVPSVDEVQFAVSALQQAHVVRDIHGAKLNKDVELCVTSPTAFSTELDLTEPSKMSQPNGNILVYDAFHLLQTDKSVQRMVFSLSSDKAVWDAVLNNEAVRELKESYVPAEDYSLPSLDENSDADGSNSSTNIVQWIFDTTTAKATELFQTIMKLVSDVFQPSAGTREKTGELADPFEEKLRASFFLAVVVLLVVFVSRAHGG